ncbi:hypothetical protein KUCAC02_037541, partial [Chaenocephalus aceratus]
VLCSSSVMDSPEYWLRNEKALCRLGLLDDDTEGGCTLVSEHTVHQRLHPHGNTEWSNSSRVES